MLTVGDKVKYTRLTKTLNDKGTLVPSSEVYDHVTDTNIDWYRSVFFYNDEHYATFMKENTIRGIYDVKTNFLIWDFDSADDIEKARKDTVELITRLMNSGIPQDSFNVCFSGNKGFSVEMEIDAELNPEQFKNITMTLAKDLVTRDTKIVNPSRVFRLPFTKHPTSGLFKTPLTVDEVCSLNTTQIKELAATQVDTDRWNSDVATFPKSLIPSAVTKPTTTKTTAEVLDSVEDLDFSLKPKNMPSCKYAIMHGFFESGNRSHSLIALASHFRNQGFPKEVAYQTLKGAAKMQAARTGQKEFSKDEIWHNIVGQVYSSYWKGGTYSCKDHEFLKEICDTLGEDACGKKKSAEKSVVDIKDVFSSFKVYARDIEKNTIKMGIKSIDDKIRLQAGSHVVLAGSSGSGKTTLVLNILNKLSEAGSVGLFMSMDMNSNLICQKLAQRVTEYEDDKIYDIYKNNNKEEIKDIEAKIDAQYKNIKFDFRSGMNVSDIRKAIEATKEAHGSEVRLVVIDFINRIGGPYSDETANLAFIAPKLSDLANDTGTLIISLAQISRAKGGPDTPLTSSRVAKGSSAIEESATVLFGIWRPGYNKGKNDKYMCIAALKTRMGREFMEPLHFNGLTSEIRELSNDEQTQFEYFVDQIEEEKSEKDKDNGKWG